MRHDSLFHCFELYDLINYFLHNSVNFDINIFFNNDLLNSNLHHWDLHDLLNLLDSLFDNNLGYNPFDNLRNLHYFLNNTRHHNNLLDYLLNLYNFRHLNHLLNNLLHWYLDLFNAVHMSQYLNYLFLDVFYWLRHFNVVVHYLLNLHNLWLLHNYRVSNLNYNRHLPLNDLNNRFFDKLLYS